MASYTNKLEPSAGYCNDRTIYSGDTIPVAITTVKPYTNSNDVMFFGTYVRNYETANVSKTPSLTCPRGDVDNYHYVANGTGVANGLKYPTALLTADEVSIAGSGRYMPSQGSFNTNSFLCSGHTFWLLSPESRYPGGVAFEFSVTSDGYLSSGVTYNTDGIRPSISLNHETTVMGGSGTATDPWTINE